MISIAVLGDSSSSGIGAENKCYPIILYRLLCERTNCRVYNYAAPGMTSSDVKAFYFDRLKRDDLDFLIIYLGNNEGSYSKYKGYTPEWLRGLKKICAKKPYRGIRPFVLKQKYLFKQKLSPISIANTPEDFKKNITAIVKKARLNNTGVILINPVANTYYYGGAGEENFIFFKLVGHNEAAADYLVACDDGSALLKKGLQHQEGGDIDNMMKCYDAIDRQTAPLAWFIAQNNKGVFYAQEAEEKAAAAFRGLIGIYGRYDPVIYFNLFLLYEKTGEERKAVRCLESACKNDISLYRIKDAYRKVLFDVSRQHKTDYIDLHDVLCSDDLIDYCHPTPEGHKKLAENIMTIIKPAGHAAERSDRGNYYAQSPSPDYFFSDRDDIIDYYFIDCEIKPDIIPKTITRLMDNHSFEQLCSCDLVDVYRGDHPACYLIGFFSANTDHPIFNAQLDFTGTYVPFSNEIFTMPENFLYRVLFNYFEECECTDELAEALDERYCFRAAHYSQMILRHHDEPLHLPLNISERYLEIIGKKIGEKMQKGTLFADMIFFRKKSIIYWYTREAFRYGTHSRNSMLYNRWEIETVIEALIVAMVIAQKKEKPLTRYRHLLRKMFDLIDIHEDYVMRYRQNRSFSRHEYDAALGEIRCSCLEAVTGARQPL